MLVNLFDEVWSTSINGYRDLVMLSKLSHITGKIYTGAYLTFISINVDNFDIRRKRHSVSAIFNSANRGFNYGFTLNLNDFTKCHIRPLAQQWLLCM